MITGLLGKRPPRRDPRTFRLSNYVEALPPAPPLVDWTIRVPEYGMLLNDKLGCCVIAGMMHLAMQQHAAAGLPIPIPSEAEVIAMYSAIGGYVPGDPSTDNGCVMLDALNYWRQHGLTFGGVTHRITAFAAVKPRDVPSALWLFGGTLDGYALPEAVQDAEAWMGPSSERGAWSPGSWGGHCVESAIATGGATEVVTWGQLCPVGADFRAAYCDESYVVFTPEWIEANGNGPCGFRADELLADLGRL